MCNCDPSRGYVCGVHRKGEKCPTCGQSGRGYTGGMTFNANGPEREFDRCPDPWHNVDPPAPPQQMKGESQ